MRRFDFQIMFLGGVYCRDGVENVYFVLNRLLLRLGPSIISSILIDEAGYNGQATHDLFGETSRDIP